jgi:hypothetical protein
VSSVIEHFLMFIAVPFINFCVLLMIFRKLWHVDRELDERTKRFEHIERTLDELKNKGGGEVPPALTTTER